MSNKEKMLVWLTLEAESPRSGSCRWGPLEYSMIPCEMDNHAVCMEGFLGSCRKQKNKRQACFPRTSSSVGNARKPGRTYYSLPKIAARHLSSSLNVLPLQQCQEQASGSWTLMGNIRVTPDQYHLPLGVGRPGRLSYFNSIESWSRFNVAIRYHPVTVAVGVLMWNSEMKLLPS